MEYQKMDKVLVVDDEKSIRLTLSEFLDVEGYKVDLAADFWKAKEFLKNNSYDAFIFDIVLPKVSGIELLKYIQEQNIDSPVIMITGYPELETSIEALRLGAYDYIPKPIDRHQLLKVVKNAVEKKKLMDEKKELEQKNQKIIENLPSALLILDKDLKVKSANPRFYQIFKTNKDESIGKLICNAIKCNRGYIDGNYGVHKECPILQNILFLSENGENFKNLELEYICKINGTSEKRFLSVIGAKLNSELLIAIDDITDKKNAEIKLINSSKLATLGEMSTGMAHEINQPLNVISLTTGLLKMLKERGALTDEKFYEKIEIIDQMVNRIAKLMDHLRNFARQDKYEFSEMNIKESINGALSIMGERLRRHSIELILDIPSDLPSIHGQVNQIEQVIINLITNAIYAMDETNPPKKQLTISARYLPDIAKIQLEVSDTGGGIPSNIINRIFEPFFTTKEVGKGTGLGLSISYGIIKSHNGEITVENTDLGAKFKILLPIYDK